MKKIILVAVIVACLLESGCVSTKTILNYKEKDDSRKSAVKQCYGAEIAKRPNSKYVFPVLKNDETFVLYALCFYITIPMDLISTIFVFPFTKTAGVDYGKIIVSGQLVDENNNPIKNYNFDVERNNVSTDSNGYFFKQTELNGSYKKDITITFFQSENFTDLSNDFSNGKYVSITNPYKIKYSIENDGKIKIEEGIIEIKEHSDSPVVNSEVTYENRCYISSDSFKDSLVVNWHESNNLKSDKIVLTKKELFSEKNKQLFIEAQKAEEKRQVEEAIQREKDRKEKENEDKRINVIIDKIKNNKSIAKYSPFDVETALSRVGVKSEEESYTSLFIYFQNGAFINCRMQILQVLQGQGFLIYLPNSTYIAYVVFDRTSSFYDGQWIWVKGRIVGTYSYMTTSYAQRTVPKVLAYLVSPAVVY